MARADERINEKAIAAIVAAPYDGHFSFVVTADTHNNNAMFGFLLGVANRMNPLFIINDGDFASAGLQAQYDNYARLIAASRAPVLSVMGNHERYNKGREIFTRMFGPGDFYFDYGNCRFICLDDADYRLTDDQLAWAERLLDTKLHTFLFFHAPPFTGRWNERRFNADTGATRIMELARKYQVARVFMGHMHLYDRQVIDGVAYIITGPAGGPPLIDYQGGQWGFVYVQVDGDRIVDLRVAVEEM